MTTPFSKNNRKTQLILGVYAGLILMTLLVFIFFVGARIQKNHQDLAQWETGSSSQSRLFTFQKDETFPPISSSENQEVLGATKQEDANSTPSSEKTILGSVAIRIITPDSSSQFDLAVGDNVNVCDLMQQAKNEGKIQSLTLDDKYLTTMNTLFVSEMNGSKNWIFTVNGSSPNGCSLYTVKPGDVIEWKVV